MAYQWVGPTEGMLPAASAVGQASPYFRFLPNSGLVGAASQFPQVAATASRAATPGLELMSNPALSRMATPASGLIGAAKGAGAAAEGVPMWVGSAESLAPAVVKSGGLLNAARGAIGLDAAEGAGLRAAGAGVLGKLALPAGVAMGGLQAGGMLDESSWLGGSESAANDTASKMLKWGGTGAGVGLLFGGPAGAAIGGGIGALIGGGQEFLERKGVLKAPTLQEQIDTTVHDADKAAREIGVPEEVISTLKQQYRAGKEFLEPGDKTGRTELAQKYADMVKEQTLSYAADPSAYQKSATTNADPEKRAMMLRSLLVNTVKPYADNYLAQSEATAKSLENMAAGAGDLAPMYQQQAASTRQMGSMYAANLVGQAQITPYMQALQDQAGYLNQMSSNLVSQAMGQVGQQQQPAAGSTDLTSIIDANTNQLQPQ